jgi:hypothetical protein
MARVARCCAVTISWALSARSVGAQTLTGRILDATDSLTVSGAEIRVEGARAMRSDGQGRFSLGVAPGRRAVVVRLLGYAAAADSVDVQENGTVVRDYYLVRIPRLLSTMVVKGHSVRVPSGFEDVYKRGATGEGSFVTRERIDSINPRDVAGLLHEVPFVHVNTREGVRNPISTSRCRGMLSGSAPGGNMVRLFLNGASVSNNSSVTEILRHMAPSSIQAVEVYNGPTTVPYLYQPACAVVAIWTRRS